MHVNTLGVQLDNALNVIKERAGCRTDGFRCGKSLHIAVPISTANARRLIVLIAEIA